MQNRFQSYLLTAEKLLHLYKGEMPFAAFLKNYFSQNKKHGSTDRKQISHLCYCFFRLGKSFAHKTFSEKMKIAIFLCNQQPSAYLFLFNEYWNNNWSESLEERIAFIEQVYTDFKVENIFISSNEIGCERKLSFIKNHLVQPHLFLRIRPKFETVVKDKLINNKIFFEQITTTSLALKNGTKIDEVLQLNKEVVVQDDSSQQVKSLMQLAKQQIKQPISVWDCCAASGGKSILAKDVFGEMELAVSDIRTSIITNLKKRFEEAGIKKYEAFVADLSKPIHPSKKYNFIICDAPCSGSGTWARTPEELYYFKEKSIETFSLLQKNIAINALNCLQKDGYFLYITCSVFSKENDDVVEHLLQNKNMQLITKKYFEGCVIHADTMFAALIKNTA